MTSPAHDDNRFDFLRLLAAWLVLFSHCYPLAGHKLGEPLARSTGIETWGGVGVAIFFVLSGYLVTLSLQRSPTLLEFARRRALRIYPALVTVCLLSVLLLGPWMTVLPLADYFGAKPTWQYLQTATAWQVRYGLPGVFTTNVYAGTINGALWSLPFEIGCYAALALVSVLPLPLRWKAALVCAGLFVLGLLHLLLAAAGKPALLAIDSQWLKLGFYFSLGSVFACWRAQLRPRLWPAFALLGAALLARGQPFQFPLFALGLGMLTLWLALYGAWLPRVPARLGDWSYGAYLYGFPVQQVLSHYKLYEAGFWVYVVASTVVTFALAALSWHLVEKQALRWK